jgi:phosphoserine phosphatase
MGDVRTILVRCTGRDRPGITTGLLGVLADAGADVYDMEQVVVRQRLTLDLLVGVERGDDVLKELLYHGWEQGLTLDFEVVDHVAEPAPTRRSVVTVIGQTLSPAALRGVTGAIADGGGNIDRIARLSRYPVVSFEFVISDGDLDRMRGALVDAASVHAVDVAIQPVNLERRAKRLVVMDVDSTLIQDEVIELLADVAGCADVVADITARAMAGELDFAASLRERVARLEGVEERALADVAERIRLTPGARTFVRTLKRLGYTVAVVSGGFSQIVEPLASDLGIDHAAANTLQVRDGRLTGQLEGQILDRAGKAEVLRTIAAREGVPLEQVVAVGDGANDLDMIKAAGFGVALHAKPAVAAEAQIRIDHGDLTALLYLQGYHEEEFVR